MFVFTFYIHVQNFSHLETLIKSSSKNGTIHLKGAGSALEGEIRDYTAIPEARVRFYHAIYSLQDLRLGIYHFQVDVCVIIVKRKVNMGFLY